jgi:hypothetical protein
MVGLPVFLIRPCVNHPREVPRRFGIVTKSYERGRSASIARFRQADPSDQIEISRVAPVPVESRFVPEVHEPPLALGEGLLEESEGFVGPVETEVSHRQPHRRHIS